MAAGQRDKVVHYLNRARGFRDGMFLLADDYGNAAALLAVHSAISLTDAVRMHFTGERGRGEDHSEAGISLRGLCRARSLDVSGLKHLEFLLSKKTLIAYGDERLEESKHLRAAIDAAERFAAWVRRTFPEVAREDRSHD